jgi:phosphatidylinositol-3-phosphatase
MMPHRSATACILALLAIAVSACGSSDSSPSTDAGGADGGGPGPDAAGETDASSGVPGADASAPAGDASVAPGQDGAAPAGPSTNVQHVFVIAMENHDSVEIYGDMTDAPYINGTLLAMGAHATNFTDELSIAIPSEPHYVWMEAATNAFSDATFTSDADPSASNSTSSTAHLATQIGASASATWRTYQEGLDATATGACPIHSSGFYAAKHDPFVFFQDLVGSTPSATSAACVAHHKAYSAFAADLAAGDVASYTFITPNLCNDMHGAGGCPIANTIASGDMWLSAELPRILAYATAHGGLVLLTWDEGDTTGKMPFIALGPTVKAGYPGGVSYSHSSLVKSIEEILGLPVLAKAASANNLSDLFVTFP